MYEIDKSLLEKIDALELSERNLAWRKAMKEAPWRVYVDRERLAVQSWRETEGEDLELRTAKMLKKVMDNVPIKIHPFDEIVGRPTTGVIGCQTAISVGLYPRHLERRRGHRRDPGRLRHPEQGGT